MQRLEDSSVPDHVFLSQYVNSADAGAFDRLFFKYRRLVFAVGRTVLASDEAANDAIGPTFLLLSRNARRLLNRPSLAGWLCDTAELTARNMRRLEEAHIKKIKLAGERLMTGQPSSNSSTIDLEAALRTLAPDVRKAVLLKFVQGYTYVEIGEALYCSEDAARQRVQRALERLSSQLSTAGGTVTADALARSLDSIRLEPGLARPWLESQSARVADQVQKAGFALRTKFAAGGLVGALLVITPTLVLHHDVRSATPKGGQVQLANSSGGRLPYAEPHRPGGSVLPNGFTLVYDVVFRYGTLTRLDSRVPDDHARLTVSWDGKTLLEGWDFVGPRAKAVTLIKGQAGTLIFLEQKAPLDAPGRPVDVTAEIDYASIDPGKAEWLSESTKEVAPPLYRTDVLADLPPLGPSYPNPLFSTTLDGTYSWFMGGGIPTLRDAQGNLTQFGAYDTTYLLSDYRPMGGTRIAGKIQVIHSTGGNYGGPNDYALVSAKSEPLPADRFLSKSYVGGLALVEGDLPVSAPALGTTKIYVDKNMPMSVRNKIRAVLDRGKVKP